MSTLFKVLKLLMIFVLSSFLTIWSSSAMPLPNLAGAYVNGSSTKSLAISNSQQAARLVKSQFGGKILKVQRTKVSGNPGYRVKVLKDNGHVISVTVDAVTGRISGR